MMTNEPEQPSLFEDSLWGEAFGELAHAEPTAAPTTADAAPPPDVAHHEAVRDVPEPHPDQPSLYEPTQRDLHLGPPPPAAAQPGWSRTGTPGRSAPTTPRSVLTTHLEPTQELPRTTDNVVPLRPAGPAAAEPVGLAAPRRADAPPMSRPTGHTEGAEPAPGPAPHRVRWAAVVMFVGEVAWLVLIAMIGWRLGSGWPVGAVTAGVLLATFTAVWGTWLAPKASRRLVAEDRNVVLIFIGSIITVLGAWVGLLAPTLVASLVVIAAHALDDKLALRRSRLSGRD